MAATPKEEAGSASAGKAAEKKPNLLKRLWTKSGLSLPIVLLMIKGGIPPAIVLAALESDTFAGVFTTLGYLVAIMSLLSMCIQPRAKFIQAMTFSITFVCIGAAVALLQIQCVVAARSPLRTSATSTGTSGSSESLEYDSSANAVSCVWLFISVYTTNYIRTVRPQLMLPCIQYSIFAMVASVYAPSFPNIAAGESFVKRLLTAFLTGFGIATGVSLFIIPMTSRKTVSAQMVGILGLMKASLAAHSQYMRSFSGNTTQPDNNKPRGSAEAKKLKDLVVQLGGLIGKVRLELGFARKEVAWGKLTPDDLSKLQSHAREIMLPMIGLSTFMEIMQTVHEGKEEHDIPLESRRHVEAIRRLQTEEWDEVITTSHDAYDRLRGTLVAALDHIAYQLELSKKPKKAKGDVEDAAGTKPKAGDVGFAKHLADEVQAFHRQREIVLQEWASKKGIQLPRHFLGDAQPGLRYTITNATAMRSKLNQQQLYLILFIEFLTHHAGKAILKTVKFADSKVADGTMSRNRLIFPGWRRVKKLIFDAWKEKDSDETMNHEANGGSNIIIGDALKSRKDPEHLPPSGVYEKLTDHLRAIPRYLSSPQSSFAFRAAVAAVSIGIMAFLKQTRLFFLEQRGVWAMIMTAISMDPRAGQSIFGFLCRIFGTTVAMVAALVIWYMCDENHAGIIAVFWFYVGFWIWFLVKNPTLAVVAIISMVTTVLILGYELQVDVLGIEVATSNGQAFYPVYLLGPYRLVSVIAGLGVAFFWTFFPYPVTTHRTLRKDLGATLYLLANWYSCIHTTLEVHLHLGPKIHDLPKTSPVFRLEKARTKVYGKTLSMLTRLREHIGFLKYEPQLGGKFPKKSYEDLITSMRNVFSYLALMSYSSKAFVGDEDDEGNSNEEEWVAAFRRFASEVKMTSHDLTSTLCLLSASVTDSSPLPPYLSVPRPFELGERMEEVDPELLDIEHIAHPCYAAFAVMEVGSAFITAEMSKITRLVKELVGEVDFSFHIVSTADDGASTNSTLWEGSNKTESGINGENKTKGD